MAEEKRATGITIIAIGKLFKATALIVIGVGAFGAGGKGGPRTLGHWADLLRIDPHNHYVDRAIALVAGESAHKLHEIGIGTFVYAALFLVEGSGLWLRKHWAEWLTIGITTSFIPIEVWEIDKDPTAGRIVALVVNVAAVIHLLVHLRTQRMQRMRAHDRPSAAAAN